MKRWWIMLGCAAMAMLQIIDCTSYCTGQDTCSACIQKPTCLWCMKNETISNSTSTRCRSSESADIDKWKEDCEYKNIIDIDNSYEVKDPDEDDREKIIMMKPQRSNMDLRVMDPFNMTLEYKHAKNYPTDFYYLVDGSRSMKDDIENLKSMAYELTEALKNLTENFHLGYGLFVDKPVLPYVSTSVREGETQPDGFRHLLKLTKDAEEEFKKKLEETDVAANLDSPEGGFDALMQLMACTEEIGWRAESLKFIILSTDAGFHYAGDGKLGGIVLPNDMTCHLDSNGLYTHSAILDYPSVSQINDMAQKKKISIIFAATDKVEPLYNRLSSHINSASSAILSDDSSNIIQLLTSKVSKIMSKIELKTNATDLVQVRYFTKCKGNVMKETSQCEDLNPEDEIEYKIEFTLKKCPKNIEEQQQVISISTQGRQETAIVHLTMQCSCNCDKEGDKGYIEKAKQCNHQGTYQCGVCKCDGGYIGNKCQCEGESETNISEDLCKQTNNSHVCSNRGACECGECTCNKGTSDKEEISGEFCECTNYLNCNAPGGKICSGNGECKCNRCECNQRWTGDFCECEESKDNCIDSETGEECSGKGTCNCNKCECNPNYNGKLCEDCPDCTSGGKCVDYKSCVQCKAFGTGEFSPEECETNCTLFNVIKVKEVNASNEDRSCSFFDEDNCRFVFRHSRSKDDTIQVYVQEELECPRPVNILGVILGVLGTIVIIGLIALVAWKIIVTRADKKEVKRFLLSLGEKNWHLNQNPLYKEAVTQVENPIFGLKD